MNFRAIIFHQEKISRILKILDQSRTNNWRKVFPSDANKDSWIIRVPWNGRNSHLKSSQIRSFLSIFNFCLSRTPTKNDRVISYSYPNFIRSLIKNQMEFETIFLQHLLHQTLLQYILVQGHLRCLFSTLAAISPCDLFLELQFRGMSGQFIRLHFPLEFQLRKAM